MKYFLIIFVSSVCYSQQSINVQPRWEYDFCMSNQNHAIDNRTYDDSTTYPIPEYNIITVITGYYYEKYEAGDGYYILKYNKYKSYFIDHHK